MAPRIFISFAAEDVRYRDLLVGQARKSDTPFEFRDMSLQEPFDSKWKTKCRVKIKECHGFIVLLSKKTWRAQGARWEICCADEEGLPMLGIHIHRDDKGALPPELAGRRIVEWHWSAIANFVRRVDGKRSFWNKFFD
jgi:hypothetical protein